ALLQILEDGRLTDSQGRVVNFKNTVVIMTSNIGSEILARAGDADLDGRDDHTGKSVQSAVRNAMRDYFKPEFLNRVDEIVVFKALSREVLSKIVDLELARVEARLAERKLSLDVDAKARAFLAEKGYDPAYGARPLRRAIQKTLLDPLSLLILEGKYDEGDTVSVGVDADADGLSIR
ncbi:MAG TPA: AAA family ATPase, partial [Sumerlaeia bacterium]|nr:AAA family ATPase [Sumerlaeia bacterium]